MQIRRYLNNGAKFVKAHDNTICAVVAVIGVIGTVAATVKATLKTKHDLDEYERELDEMEEDDIPDEKEIRIEKTKIILKDGWYVVLSAGGTILFMLASHKLSLKKIEAGLGVAGYWRDKHMAYKGKVKERFGEEKEKDISAELAKDKFDENSFDSNQIYQIGRGQVLFIDPFGRLIRSSIQEIIQMQYDYNHHYYDEWAEEWTSLNTVNEWFNLPNIWDELGDNIGFSRDWPLDIQINNSKNGPMLPTGEIATVLEYGSEPVFENGTDMRHFRY